MPGEFNQRKKGQAAAELIICGSLFLMLLGVLAQYGIRYNARQKLIMESFRDSLKEASSGKADESDGYSGAGEKYLSYQGVYIEDTPVPDVSSAYGFPKLSPVYANSSATRTYFMQATEMVKESNMPRQHFLFKSKDGDKEVFKKRQDYDEEFGAGKDGFTTAGLKKNIGLAQKSETECKQVCDPEPPANCEEVCETVTLYRVIRIIPDPEDKLPLATEEATEGDNIYWTWAEITTTKLTSAEGSNNTAVAESIKDILKSVWEDAFPGEDDEGNTPAAKVYGHVTNLGVDLFLSEPLSEDDLWKDVADFRIISQGTQLHPSCLQDTDIAYTAKVITIVGSKVNIKSSAWADINMEDVTDTKRGMAKQGLLPGERKEISTRDLKLINDLSSGSKTQIDYSDKIIRYIKLNSGDIIEIVSERDIDKEKYSDEEWQY